MIKDGISDLLGIDKIRTTNLHSQSDGIEERFNKTILYQLSKFVEEYQRDWDRKVQVTMMSYRSVIHESTQYSSTMLMFGGVVRFPGNIVLGEKPSDDDDQEVASICEKLVKISARLT